jgi:hypothetical protein
LPASGFNDCVTHKLSRGEKAAQNSTYGRVWQTQSLVSKTARSLSGSATPQILSAMRRDMFVEQTVYKTLAPIGATCTRP